MAPEAEAPDLMAFDEVHGSCYFRRQPVTPAEIERACRAVEVACCDAVQYEGDDPQILPRLHELHPAEYRAPDAIDGSGSRPDT